MGGDLGAYLRHGEACAVRFAAGTSLHADQAALVGVKGRDVEETIIDSPKGREAQIDPVHQQGVEVFARGARDDSLETPGVLVERGLWC